MTNEDKKAAKEHKEAHKVYKVGDKYMCAECGSEITLNGKCPTCKLDINWPEVLSHVRLG